MARLLGCFSSGCDRFGVSGDDVDDMAFFDREYRPAL